MWNNIRKVLGDKVVIKNNQIVVKSTSQVKDILRILKLSTSLQFKSITDIVAVDEGSLRVLYLLASVRYSERVEVVVGVPTNEVESMVDLYGGVDWLEREVYDMFGLIFLGHPNLRRILTDYGFKGSPLKKSFKTYHDVRYDVLTKLVDD